MFRYNVCVFAYGQTGSGKTHTLTGPPYLVNIIQIHTYWLCGRDIGGPPTSETFYVLWCSQQSSHGCKVIKYSKGMVEGFT